MHGDAQLIPVHRGGRGVHITVTVLSRGTDSGLGRRTQGKGEGVLYAVCYVLYCKAQERRNKHRSLLSSKMGRNGFATVIL